MALPLLLFFLFLSVSNSQSIPPQNIETFYPFPINFTPPPPPPPSSSSPSTRTIVTAVVVTAVGMALISTLFFFFLQKYLIIRRKRKTEEVHSGAGEGPVSTPAVAENQFSRLDGNLKGFIVDEDGLDVIYWKRLERRKSKNNNNTTFDRSDQIKNSDHPVQEIPLLRGKSSTSHVKIPPENEQPTRITPPPPPPPPINNPPPFPGNSVQAVGKPPGSLTAQPQPPPLPPQIPNNKSSVSPPPPPPPPIPTVSRPPPPPPPIPAKTNSSAPPPPPIPTKTNPAAPPPPPPKAGSSKLPLRPAPPKQGKFAGESSSSANPNQIKMKPLHWDKVNTANADHSMVWDKMHAGSFQFDGDLMEALFGSVAANRKSPLSDAATSSSTAVGRNSTPPQIFILEPKKSQNIAIVVKSLTIPRNEILDSLYEGQGLETEILEKLTRIALTKEEISQILSFKGDPLNLADAESFLYHVLKSVPSAFTRFNAMLFRLNFTSEILFLKESLQTLELACKELKTRGLFMKLLEAVLKAGNRLNAGTARGNARAFNLTALRKLSDVRSADGKTTLLHFVVQEVIRAEGKRCVLNRSKSMSSSTSSENSTSKEERVNEYMMLGLPVVGGLSAEFSNVKKAAAIDYESFVNTAPSLTGRTGEIRGLLSEIGKNEGGGGFEKEMKGFVEGAEDELKMVREEQMKVMEMVMKTTEYYQAAAAAANSKEKEQNKLQFFIIVKDFLQMVDRVCVEIAKDLQKRRSSTLKLGSSPVRSKAVFPNLPPNFMSDKSRGSSSDSDEF